MPKDQEGSRIETNQSAKPQASKRTSSVILDPRSKGADSRISQSSNKDLLNVIQDNKG
jgi:hypothetical protein